MDVKASTKTWRDPSLQEPDLKEQANNRNLTQGEKAALGGAENIGEALNKMSDPNYVDPSKKMRGVGDSKMDKDAFFKLMIAQLKNQDPTNPLKNHEMAAQLAQFSGLEQMTNINTTLQEMKQGAKPVEQFQALNLIGKEVSGDSAKLTRTNLDKDHEVKFNLPQDATETVASITNAKGDVIRTMKFPTLKAGENKFSWNGNDEKGNKAKEGDYKIKFESTGAAGQKLNVKTDFTGVVTGMSFSQEGPVLQVGKQNVRLKDISRFSDPSLKNNDQKANDVTNLDLNKDAASKQTNIKQETKTPEQLKAMESSPDDMWGQLSAAKELYDKNQFGEGNKPAEGSNVAPATPPPKVAAKGL
ncbi:flagellar biosynthesis protein FlgD [Bdellovibrio sp. qaytius]|nr:flagellar biosynthesis protein FlgD [Bdellovibrio sp. qaytius]